MENKGNQPRLRPHSMFLNILHFSLAQIGAKVDLYFEIQKYFEIFFEIFLNIVSRHAGSFICSIIMGAISVSNACAEYL